MDTAELQKELIEQIKLIKNTKGYNWEIKVLGLDIDKVEKMNNEMKKRFETNEINTPDI